MNVEQVARDVPDRQEGEGVTVSFRDMPKVVNNVHGNENSACEEGHRAEEIAHHTEETQVDRGIKTDLIHQHWFLRMQKRRDPAEYRVRYPWRLFIANMVFDFGLVDNLSKFMD